MGKITFLLCLFSISFSFSQGTNKVDTKGKKQGPWQKNYPGSNALEYKGQFIDDQPTGTFYHYYPSTKKKAIVFHNEKTKRSVAHLFDENGVEVAFGIYINQKKDSVWTYYGPSGRLSCKETFKNDKLNGKRTVYYIPEDINDKSQIVAKIENYVDGLKDGEETEYFDTGVILSSCKYVKGERVGKYTRNHPNGKAMSIQLYKNGVLHGWSRAYDQSGLETGKRYFKNGNELTGKELDAWLTYCKGKGINPND